VSARTGAVTIIAAVPTTAPATQNGYGEPGASRRARRDPRRQREARDGERGVASSAERFPLPGRPSHGLGSRPSKTRRFNSKAAPPPTVKLVWASLAAQADKEGWLAGRFLAAFAEHEIAERSHRRLERHLAEARLPPGKTLFASSTLIKKIDQSVEAGDAVGKSLTYDFVDLVGPSCKGRGRYKLDYDIGPRRRTSQNHRVWHARVMPERGNMGSPRLIPARGASSGNAAFRRRRAGPKTVRRRNRSPSWASAMTGQRTVYDRRDAISRRHPWLAMDQGSAPRAREGLKTQQMIRCRDCGSKRSKFWR
jgi:hypothetical protein